MARLVPKGGAEGLGHFLLFVPLYPNNLGRVAEKGWLVGENSASQSNQREGEACLLGPPGRHRKPVLPVCICVTASSPCICNVHG